MSVPDVVPFEVSVPEETLGEIRRRVAAFPWSSMPDTGGWEYGTPKPFLQELCAYWLDEYDWSAEERRLNRFPQYHAELGDLRMHFVRERGSREDALPLVLLHGWPGSHAEFLPIVERLAHPESDDSEGPAFDVIVPSLPGYGFSDPPQGPIDPRAAAEIVRRLLHDAIGLDRYVVQGGDWGSAIAGWLAHDDPGACLGLHLNMLGLRPGSPPDTEEELAWGQRTQAAFRAGGDYFRIQAAQPQTLGYAMTDSPVGALAWIVEKFHAWSQLDGGDLWSVYDRDTVLTNVMLYLVEGRFTTALWLYRGLMESSTPILAPGDRVEVPTGIAAFPGDTVYPMPPRSYAEKAFNVVHWSEPERGGHFAALEEPDRFVEDVRAFVAHITEPRLEA